MLAPINDPFAPPRFSIHGDGVIEGYASLFGEVDSGNDMVMPGAFTQTLNLRGLRRIPMLFQHDPSEPVGIWLDLHEDSRGLFARGRLIPDVARARELLALVKSGAIDGLSIGYRTVSARVDPRTRVRKLYHVDLWEVSIVTFPLLNGARVQAAKTALQPKQSFARKRAETAWSEMKREKAAGVASPLRRAVTPDAIRRGLRGRAHV